MLLDLLPKTGTFLFVKMVREVMEALSFSEEEQKKLGFHQDIKGAFHWNEKAAIEIVKEIEIPETIKDKIVSELAKLEEKKNVSIDQIGLYEIFVSKE